MVELTVMPRVGCRSDLPDEFRTVLTQDPDCSWSYSVQGKEFPLADPAQGLKCSIACGVKGAGSRAAYGTWYDW